MEKRESIRSEKVERLKGKLYDVINFKVLNISHKGLSFVCGFITKVSKTYIIYLSKNGKRKDFKIKIVRAEAHPFDEKYSDLHSDGMLYNVGAEFVDMDEEKKFFLEYVINEETDFLGEFFIEQ